MMPLTTSRTFTSRLRPPRLAGGIRGSIWPHSSSVRSLGYLSPSRLYLARVFVVHISSPRRVRIRVLANEPDILRRGNPPWLPTHHFAPRRGISDSPEPQILSVEQPRLRSGAALREPQPILSIRALSRRTLSGGAPCAAVNHWSLGF